MKQPANIFFGLFLFFINGSAMGASDVDVTADLTTEIRAGRLATGVDDTVQTTGQLVITPSLAVTRTSPRANSTLRYQPHLFSSILQEENEAFLLYHQFMLLHDYTISRRAQWNATGTLDYGRLDYSRSLFRSNTDGEIDGSGALESRANSRVETPIVRYLAFRGSTGMTYRTTPTSLLNLLGSYGTTRLIEDSQPTDQVEAETDTSDEFSHTVGINASIASTISPTDQIIFSTVATAARFDDGTLSFPANISLAWQRQLQTNTSFSIISGVAFITEENIAAEPAEGEDNVADTDVAPYVLHVLPTGGFDYTVQPNWNTITRWTLSGSALVSTYVDTVEAAVLPQLSTRFSAISEVSARSMFLMTVAASTRILSDSERTGITIGNYPATLSATSEFQFIVTPEIELRSGIEWNARASYPFDSPIDLGPWELVGVISLILRLPPND